MPDILLENVILKYQRGEEQLKDFLTQLNKIKNDHQIKLEFKRVESSLDAFEYALVIPYVPSVEKDIGILLGETVQSFRISLDYLAWALVEATGNKLLDREELQVAFPVAENKEKFEKIHGSRLPYVPSDQLAIIEKYQPYHTTIAGISMGYLQKLSNTDKHQIIVPVGIFPNEFEAKVKPEGAKILEVIKEYIDGQELGNGIKIFTFIMDGEPKKWNAFMGFKAAYAVSNSIIKPPPQFLLAPIDQVIEGIRQACFQVISEFKLNG